MSLSNFTVWLDAQVAALRTSKHIDKIKKFFAYFGLFMALGSAGVMLTPVSPFSDCISLAVAVALTYFYVRTESHHVILLALCLTMLTFSFLLLVFCFSTVYALACVLIHEAKQDRQQTA